jgi:hypothetical protein
LSPHFQAQARGKIGTETLKIFREGVSWLQAAGLNHDGKAISIVQDLFGSDPNRYFRGLTGATEAERTQNLLQAFSLRQQNSYGQVARAFKEIFTIVEYQEPEGRNLTPQEQLEKGERERLAAEAREKLCFMVAESRKQIHSNQIEQAFAGIFSDPHFRTSFSKGVAEFLVEPDYRSPFFDSPTRITERNTRLAERTRLRKAQVSKALAPQTFPPAASDLIAGYIG